MSNRDPKHHRNVRRQESGISVERGYLETLLHEMLHAYFFIYSCECSELCREVWEVWEVFGNDGPWYRVNDDGVRYLEGHGAAFGGWTCVRKVVRVIIVRVEKSIEEVLRREDYGDDVERRLGRARVDKDEAKKDSELWTAEDSMLSVGEMLKEENPKEVLSTEDSVTPMLENDPIEGLVVALDRKLG